MTAVWEADPAGVYFSDEFAIEPNVLEAYGALDISVVTDLPLFIDPFLLFNSANPTYQALHTQIIDYLRFLRSKADLTLDQHLIATWYQFGEVKQNWLGFTDGGNSGHGLGRGFAVALHGALTTLLDNLGSETATESTHLEKLALVRAGIGRDTISDFTTNLIKHFLLDYTQAFTLANVDPEQRSTFAVPRVAFNYGTESWVTRTFTLPVVGTDYVLLTPMDMLTKDDTWINRSDMLHKFDRLPDAVPDGQQRALIMNYLGRQLSAKSTEQERKEAKARTIAAFPELVDLYIKIQEDEKDKATAVSRANTDDIRGVLVDQVKLAAADLAAKTDLYDKAWTSYDEARKAVTTFKHYVEHQDGYLVINRGGGVSFSNEKEVQGFFGLLLAQSRFDVNREPNNGRGPVDFKLSEGSADKSLIEFKLAKSTSLKRNLQRQLPIYEEANETRTSVTVIISYTDADEKKVNTVLTELGLAAEPSIVVIDARADNKPSGSTA
jgi:hypothetical protein